jgi:hypothetical protein
MSLTPTAAPVSGVTRTETGSPAATPRRVRHQARDVVAVMAFSASTSLALAGGLLLLSQLGR